MPAPKGNRFWEVRSSHGRKPKFDDPQKLWEACAEYFEWVEDNPLWEYKVAQFQGVPVDMQIPKMRPMTLSGLCIFLDICQDTWANYRKTQDLIGVTKAVEEVIYNQKFSGAAADLLNANIIARDLGLKDESKHEHTGKDGEKLEFSSDKDFARAVAFYLTKGVKESTTNNKGESS